MKIYLGADHGGYQLKETLKTWLEDWGYDYEDCGAPHLDPQDDYPQYAWAVAEKVAETEGAQGILLCRFGGGMTIAANKKAGVRAVMAQSPEAAFKARDDNNANILVLSADLLTAEAAQEIIKTFLETPFSHQDRHQRRLSQIAELEKKSR